MLRRFEALLDPTAGTPAPPPNAGLSRFYWFYIRQVQRPHGRAVRLRRPDRDPGHDDPGLHRPGRQSGVHPHPADAVARRLASVLLGMAVVLLLLRPLSVPRTAVLVNQIVNPGFSNMIRWQNHWHVVRQSWTFFQNDFAGRIANRVMQTGPALRESLVMAFDAAWYILVYGSSALLLLGSLDWRLTLPMLLLVRLLRRHAALLRAAAARPLPPRVGDALDPDRPRRGQLHQHPDGQAVRPRARRGRLRARGDRRPHRRVPRPDAHDHRLHHDRWR